jgi:hypothetical protein
MEEVKAERGNGVESPRVLPGAGSFQNGTQWVLLLVFMPAVNPLLSNVNST